MLGVKKRNAQAEWVEALEQAREFAATPQGQARNAELIEKACERIPADSRIYGWSGGKDTLALQVVAEAAGVERGVFGTIGWRWEYPSFREYVEANIPANVEARDFGYSAEFMNEHPQYVFPQTAKDAYFWYVHCNQRSYYGYARDMGAENVILGHRRIDGNVVRDGVMVKDGIRKVFPLYDYSHEDVFLIIACAGVELPAIYFTEGGFFQGTHAWVMRGGRDALDEIWRIDKSILTGATDIEKVAEYVKRKEG